VGQSAEQKRRVGRPHALSVEQQDRIYAEYRAASDAGTPLSFEQLAYNWQISKTTVYHAIRSARLREEWQEKANPGAFKLKPADVLGQIERGFKKLEGLKKEISIVEEHLRKMFHLVKERADTPEADSAKGPRRKRGPHSIRVQFHGAETREFQLSAGYGSDPEHKLTPDEEAYEKHRYVVRDLLEPEHDRTEPAKGDEALVRLRKEIDRKKLTSWAAIVMRMRNLVNAWEDLERGVILERDLEALSDYLTGLEKKNEAEGLSRGA